PAAARRSKSRRDKESRLGYEFMVCSIRSLVTGDCRCGHAARESMVADKLRTVNQGPQNGAESLRGCGIFAPVQEARYELGFLCARPTSEGRQVKLLDHLFAALTRADQALHDRSDTTELRGVHQLERLRNTVRVFQRIGFFTLGRPEEIHEHLARREL